MANKPSTLVKLIAKAFVACGWDGSDWQAQAVDSDGHLQVDIQSASTAGLATEAKQDTGNTSLGTIANAVRAAGSAVVGYMVAVGGWDGSNYRNLSVDSAGVVDVSDANQGKDPGVKVTFTGAAYAGAVLTSTETLQASTAYWLKDWTGQLTGGTGGNTTQPSIGETSTFTQGSLNDRYKISATLTTGGDRTVDSLPGGIIVRTDAGGKLYARGAAPAAADSTLSLRAELVQMRAGA
jgi:hypothetical protein